MVTAAITPDLSNFTFLLLHTQFLTPISICYFFVTTLSLNLQLFENRILMCLFLAPNIVPHV